MVTQLSNKKVASRKTHQCNFCLGQIDKDEVYQRSTNVFDGDIYTWKNHLMCGEIASKLKMYDDADEGVTQDWFQERIEDEYQKIMSEKHTELYESKDFKYPPFQNRLNFVIDYYFIKQ